MKAGLIGTTTVVATLLLSSCTGPQPGSAEPSKPSHPNEIRTVTPTWISGLQVVSNHSESASCPWATAYPAIPGADALTATLRDKMPSRPDEQAADPETGCPSGETPEINISFRFLAAAGDVVGVELTTVDYSSAGDGTTIATYWFDTRSKKSLPATALLADNAGDDFVTAVVKALSGHEGVDPGNLKAALVPEFRASTLTDLAFTEGGDLVARFDQGAVAAVPAGRQQAVIPRVQAEPLLSDLGRRAQQQALRPGNRLDLDGAAPTTPRPPAPAPQPSTVDCQRVRCVALTFDDGPGPDTGKLLDTLARFGAHATFFVVGQNATYHGDLLRREAAEGHEIGNHSWSHPDLRKLTADQVRDQLDRTDQAIADATGRKPTLIRPPYGAINDTVRGAVERPMALWSLDTLDWKFRDSTKVTQTVLDTVKPGDIVLLHDNHPTSVAAVPAILSGLKDLGYQFVTVSQLFGSTQLTPGKTYGDNEKAFGRN
ncbi:peptidoglycan/xylan/chitin deacetylase (PgdA/CDA1 family) [Kibdelosporangium banguiense]|uniref:Peptidoglycan/xylan/chitin deacetylase (PgdA/CDA1 family) n=1 Tax=Kibdelosporangium banguiense TaxID=1365924 RepID=A0ABS4TX39_9PSEU|nr:polysaccharide deacetylase family protein [Kibdelosporangium banguiense]MBP2328954.1 peptidoglycan/xylan/chitin deacetylase (PgdA/CDA1 family) [Kibdelosporangium banguiense]